jgi:choline dehydrogenase-like flavoprotein
MADLNCDVAVVGAGIAGGIVARHLAAAGVRVIVLEAGEATGQTWDDYQSNVRMYMTAGAKVPNSAYPNSPAAPSPNVLDKSNLVPGGPPGTTGYFVQYGPQPFGSDYQRSKGGTMLHWYGHAIRMLPNDFRMKSIYGQGEDWPIGYGDLIPYYELAEREIGVAAEVDERSLHGSEFSEGYVFPMFKVPPSYVDSVFAAAVNGKTVTYGGDDYEIGVSSLPEGRNTIPNPDYDGGRGYVPVGAVGRPQAGLRCEGNSSCIPICPVQAKYNALKTLDVATRNGARIVTQAVASQLEFVDGLISGIRYQRWSGQSRPTAEWQVLRARIYVLAANAIENVTLMLGSGIQHEQLGHNLMDHPFLPAWGLAPGSVGAFRGPGSTSGIESLRDGPFRSRLGAFRSDISNWGWDLTGAPVTNVEQAVHQDRLCGASLRRHLAATVPRQIQLGFLVEQLPDVNNRVTIDPGYRDVLGNYRPVIHYDIGPYTRAGLAAARQVSRQVFALLGAEDATVYDANDPGYLEWEGQGYWALGAGHVMGTHRMGATASRSVVDTYQRCWDHPNLFLVGCGSMPTTGTSNPTLTLAALAFRTVEHILAALRSP